MEFKMRHICRPQGCVNTFLPARLQGNLTAPTDPAQARFSASPPANDRITSIPSSHLPPVHCLSANRGSKDVPMCVVQEEFRQKKSAECVASVKLGPQKFALD